MCLTTGKPDVARGEKAMVVVSCEFDAGLEEANNLSTPTDLVVGAVFATMKVGRRLVAFVWRYRYPNVFEFFVCFSSVTVLQQGGTSLAMCLCAIENYR